MSVARTLEVTEATTVGASATATASTTVTATSTTASTTVSEATATTATATASTAVTTTTAAATTTRGVTTVWARSGVVETDWATTDLSTHHGLISSLGTLDGVEADVTETLGVAGLPVEY